jgi:hypothetical protein
VPSTLLRNLSEIEPDATGSSNISSRRLAAWVVQTCGVEGKARGVADTRQAGTSLANGADFLRRAVPAWIESDFILELYRSGPCRVWIKVRNPASIAAQRERSEIWNR